jgi:hypothetical protein
VGSVLATASIAATGQKKFVTIAARARSYKQQTKPKSGETNDANWKKNEKRNQILAM